MQDKKRYILYAVRSDYGADSKVYIDSWNDFDQAHVDEDKMPEASDAILLDTKTNSNWIFFDEWYLEEESLV